MDEIEPMTEAEALSDQYDEYDTYYPARKRNSEGKRKSSYTRRHAGGGTKLSQSELNARRGNPAWCQKCLKRHVNKGYSTCFFCS